MKYDTILFDLDGTLLNTLDDLTDSINHTLNNYNLPGHTVAEVRSFVGNGLRKLAERAVPDFSKMDDFDNFLDDFVKYYNSHNLIKTAPYKGVIDVTKKLDEMGIKMAIVTNKGQTASDSLLKDFFYPYIKLVIGDDGKRAHKPAPDNIYEALKTLGVDDKSKVLYIGDSEVDAQTAINSGLDYILCTYGFRDMDVLSQYKPVAFVNEISEIIQYL